MSCSEVLELFLFGRDDLLKHQLVVMAAVGMLVHEILHPFRHCLFADSSVFILWAFPEYSFDLAHVDLLWLPAKLLRKILLMVIENHHGEILSLMFIKVITLVNVVLFPNLIDNMVNQLLIISVALKLE